MASVAEMPAYQLNVVNNSSMNTKVKYTAVWALGLYLTGLNKLTSGG